MALAESMSASASRRGERPLQMQTVFSSAIASVADVCERLGLLDQEAANFRQQGLDDPNRDPWLGIHGVLAEGAIGAALAARLHHRAAADLDDIERELNAIATMIDRDAA